MITAIYHIAGMGDVEYLKHTPGAANARRAALFCQFRFDELFPTAPMQLWNRDVAMLLVELYGFERVGAVPDDQCHWIEMFGERERACGDPYRELMLDVSLYRDRLDSLLHGCLQLHNEFAATLFKKL